VTQYFSEISPPVRKQQGSSSYTSPALQVQRSKMALLQQVLSSLAFYQCIVFCNRQSWCSSIVDALNDAGWPSAFISGAMLQAERTAAMEGLRNFQLRVLVSTDLVARGVDVERVNLVINMDMPADPETYLHRVGRTGRFGTRGLALSFVLPHEMESLSAVRDKYGTTITPMPTPDEITAASYEYTLQNETDKVALASLHSVREAAQKAAPEPSITGTTDDVPKEPKLSRTSKPPGKQTGRRQGKCGGQQRATDMEGDPELDAADAPSKDAGHEALADHSTWYYSDMCGDEQGPFDAAQMAAWVEEGYLDAEVLMVRRGDSATYAAMGDVFWGSINRPHQWVDLAQHQRLGPFPIGPSAAQVYCVTCGLICPRACLQVV